MSILLLLALVCVVVGLIGTVMPGLPGTTLVLGGLVLAAYADGFTRVGWGTLAILGVLTMLSFAADFFATVLGAQRVGASKLALVGAAVGMLAGIPFALVGILLGPFVGAVVGELLHRRFKQKQSAKEALLPAGKVGVGAWLGMLVGTLAKLILVALMIGLFATVYFSNSPQKAAASALLHAFWL
jgi:uncharacterized protein